MLGWCQVCNTGCKRTDAIRPLLGKLTLICNRIIQGQRYPYKSRIYVAYALLEFAVDSLLEQSLQQYEFPLSHEAPHLTI